MAGRFLVVDDAGFIRDLLKKQLRQGFPGCHVVDVPDAGRAQAALRSQRFDLILCDWEMPGMSGEEFLRWLREQPEFGQLPFIMVTSRGEREYVIRAVQAGASDYLGKPFSAETLLNKVRKHFRGDGGGRKAAAPVNPVPQGIAAASVAVLTGGGAAKPAPAPAARPAAHKTAKRGQAQLNFSSGAVPCAIRNLSLQDLSGVMPRTDPIPALFAPVVVSIVETGGERVARLNGYVHAIAAAERRQDAQSLTVAIRFVDDDPDKLDALSHFIASLS